MLGVQTTCVATLPKWVPKTGRVKVAISDFVPVSSLGAPQARGMKHTEVALLLDAGIPKGAKTESPVVFQRNLEEELFLGVGDMVLSNEKDTVDHPGAADADAQLYLEIVQVVCKA